jgi:heptosyltransferase-3
MIYLDDTGDTTPRPLSVRRILIIQLGDIGDVVWSLPAIMAAREAYPEASLSVLLREGNGALLAADVSPPGIFEVRKGLGGFRRLAASLRLVWTLRRERFDLLFDLRGDERGGYMAFLTGAPIRVAQYYPDLPWPRTMLFTHLVTLPIASHLIQRAAAPSLGILRAFGIEGANAVPELRLSADVRRRAAKLLADEGIAEPSELAAGGGRRCDWSNNSCGLAGEADSAFVSTGGSGRDGKPWITLNPFSRYKEWDIGKWRQIVDWLSRDFGIASVIVGAPSERERADELAGACSGRVHNLAGKTTLAGLAGILERSRLHIGVDSAAPHIAAAVGTPTVTLYGPSDWRYWKPPGERHRVAVSGMDCVPCNQKGCDGSGVSRCLDTLEVDQVQAVIRKALSG